jgi:hypothetical protein
MPMPAYAVTCSRQGCGQTARYKIAARWSDGVTQELKTYALSCDACLNEQFTRSKTKQANCRLARGETLDVPGIYQLSRGERDTKLARLTDLEGKEKS